MTQYRKLRDEVQTEVHPFPNKIPLQGERATLNNNAKFALVSHGIPGGGLQGAFGTACYPPLYMDSRIRYLTEEFFGPF